MILYWYIINSILKILDKRLSTCEIIYTDPLNADTDGDGLKDGEEIIPQFKFVNSSSIGLLLASCGIYFNMLSDPNMSDTDGDRIGDKIDENKLTKNIYDYGAIIYDEKVYPIYIPDYTKEHIIASDWKIDFDSSSSKNMWNFMDFISGCTIGISLDDNTDLKDSCIYAGLVMVTNKYRSRNIDCRYGTIFSVIEGVNTAIQNVYDNVKIHVSLLSSKSSGRQAIIEAGTYKRSAVYEEYAGSIPYSAFWNMCGGFTYSGAVLNNSLHKLYTSISGDNTDYGNYDLLVHIDAAHKDDEYSSYLWLDSNMSLMESPKIYNGDSVEIVQTNFLGWPIKTLTKLSICNSCSVSGKYKEFFEQFFIKNNLNWD